MTRLEYYLKALRDGAALRKAWVIKIFAVSSLREAAKGPTYPWELLNDDGHYAFFDSDGQYYVFEESDVSEPFLNARSPITLAVGDLLNVTNVDEAGLITTVGNALFNAICVVYPFGDKVPFQLGKVNLGKLEKHIIERLMDDPSDDGVLVVNDFDSGAKVSNPIYVKELKKYIEAASALGAYATLFTPSATPRTLVPAPGAREYKAKLLAEYKDRLDDPAAIAEISKKLQDFDREWIYSDPDFGFIQKAKTIEVARSRMFYMHGIESGFSEDGSFTLIQNSLDEGWDIANLPAMANSLRDGSFNRGAMTAKGGEKTKTIFRVMSGSIVVEEDCGSQLGVPTELTTGNHRDYIGNSAIVDGALTKITEDNSSTLIGKHMFVRSPLFCHSGDNNFCMSCLGEFIRGKENAIGVVSAAVGSRLLYLFMAKMHGTALKTVKYDIATALS